MEPDVALKLVELNHSFYSRFASDFADSRRQPAEGFHDLLPLVTNSPGCRVLDVGCGDGRFGRFLRVNGVAASYAGVDYSSELLALAEAGLGEFHARDISRADCLDGLGRFDVIVCLATLQHIPSHHARVRLLGEMRAHLRDGGRIALSAWQFLNNERQRRKLRSWQELGLEDNQVEEGDFLLSWQRGGYGLRYVAYLDEQAIWQLAAEAGLAVCETFLRDGREGDLNLYAILAG